MFKDEVVAMDQGLFDKNGSRLSPGNSIYDDFNSATINKLKCATSRRFSIYGSRAHSRVGPQAIYQRKARKRKQNKRKCINLKQKLARMENAKARVLLKLLPRVNNDSMDIIIEKWTLLLMD